MKQIEETVGDHRGLGNLLHFNQRRINGVNNLRLDFDLSIRDLRQKENFQLTLLA